MNSFFARIFRAVVVKPVTYFATKLEGTARGEVTAAVIVASVASPAQAALDAYKPAVNAAIDTVADKLAAQVDARVSGGGTGSISSIQGELFSAINGMATIPTYAKAALEMAVVSASVPEAAIAAQGKAAIYAEATRLKSLVATASVTA